MGFSPYLQVALLFPGEPISTQFVDSNHSVKNTVLSLIYRTVLLWHGCLQMRSDVTVPDRERATFGINAWLKADALEQAPDSHTHGLERIYLYQSRECLFK